jgi:P27 family predicted phage terminase small subunit
MIREKHTECKQIMGNDMKLPGLPTARAKRVEKNEIEEFDNKTAQRPEVVIVDRTKLGVKDGYPNFVRSELQVFYYQAMYEQIVSNSTILKSVDSYGLGMLAINLALIDECNLSIETTGMNNEYQGDRKMVLKRNPALDVLKDAQAAVRFYLKEFNMTPASRSKILSPGGPMGKQDDGFDEI